MLKVTKAQVTSDKNFSNELHNIQAEERQRRLNQQQMVDSIKQAASSDLLEEVKEEPNVQTRQRQLVQR